MDWLTVVWAVVAGACLMLGLLHLAVWCRNRSSWANLWFFLAVVSVIGVMAGEWAIMHARTPHEFGTAFRWSHLIYGIGVAGCLGFVHCYFGSGRRWLLAAAFGLRLLAVVANFTTGESLHFRVIRSIRQGTFLGQPVSLLGEWEPNPWMKLGQFASLVMVAYVADAALRLWKRGSLEERSRAVVVGGCLIFFVVAAAGQAGLVAAGVLKMPFLVSFAFLGMVAVMGYELSRDVLRAAHLSRDLRASEQRLSLAAAAGHLALWEWDLRTDRIGLSREGSLLYGLDPQETVSSGRFADTIHADDRDGVRRAIDAALAGPDPYVAEYRVVLPDRSVRWVAAAGRLERDTRLLRGVSLDITGRKQAELESARQQQELAHLSRIHILGELAGALAHELNQPLGAILGNAQVGSATLRSGPMDPVEMTEILDDIADDAKRAGGIIHGMRAMFRNDPVVELQPLNLNEKVAQVLHLLHGEIVGRKVKLELHLQPDLPPVNASRVEIQQVLINLVMNALDAMKGMTSGGLLEITTRRLDGRIFVGVRDHGPGIPADMIGRLFEPFVSTKQGGLGLGLAISRNIALRFGGELRAENHPTGGALFELVLPLPGEGDKSCQ